MVHCPGEDVPTASLSLSSDLHVRLFGGPVVWSVFLSNGPDTCTHEYCTTWDDNGCTVIGLSFRKFCMAGEYMDNLSWYGLWWKYVALEMYCLPLHFISQLQ